MKFEHFKIDETKIMRVTSVEVAKSPRHRTVNYNLNGDMLIDQGAVKSTITVRIALMSAQEMGVIDNAVNNGIVTIEYYEGTQLKQISAVISEVSKPRPHYLYGDRANGVWYSGIVLSFEER